LIQLQQVNFHPAYQLFSFDAGTHFLSLSQLSFFDAAFLFDTESHVHSPHNLETAGAVALCAKTKIYNFQ